VLMRTCAADCLSWPADEASTGDPSLLNREPE